jgi:isopentenyl-diphosphate delta-isomerase
MNDSVILVDENDNQIGIEEKLKAHKDGSLHRAFSIFVLNSDGKLLIQRRALNKYHSAGLWANTCCGHPQPGEDIINSAHRRLKEEFGFDCQLKKAFDFKYKTLFGNGLTEHEIDHVMIGSYNGELKPDPNEIMEYKWVNIEWLEKDLQDNPEIYADWLKICFGKAVEYLRS